MSRDEIVARISRHEAELRECGATALFLFGSAARGELRPESDIDVLIDYDPARGFPNWGFPQIYGVIADEFGRSRGIDLTTRDALHPRLADRIVAEAWRVF
jgi:predicted nucleotidyltransferase